MSRQLPRVCAQFLEKMQLLYHKLASEKGIYIVGSCGFDSVPCDLGVIYTTKKFQGELNTVEGFLSVKSGPEVCTIYLFPNTIEFL